MKNMPGPSVVRVEKNCANDCDAPEMELIGLVLVDSSGSVVGLAPTPGWNDFDVREGYAEMIGGTAENPVSI